MTATEQATDLPVECTPARQPGHEGMHAQCRQTKDVPSPYGRGIPLARSPLRLRLRLPPSGQRALVKTIAGTALYVAVVTGPALALVLAQTPRTPMAAAPGQGRTQDARPVGVPEDAEGAGPAACGCLASASVFPSGPGSWEARSSTSPAVIRCASTPRTASVTVAASS